MLNKLKILATLVAMMLFLAACGSNEVEDEFEEDFDTVIDDSDSSFDDEGEDFSAPVDPWADVVNVDSVFYFDFDQSLLRPESRAALTVYARVLQESPKSVRLEGHADERGSREYNMALGERRANAVRDFLVLQGVDGSLIETVSYGEERPAEVGSFESAWSKNRRVELIY